MLPQTMSQDARSSIFHGALHSGHLGLGKSRSLLVQVDGEAVAIRDGEVGADLILHRDCVKPEAAGFHVLLKPLTRFAAGYE
jgi:hypothetical protein